MKVKILKKSIKEGDTIDGRHYSIKSLFVNFTDSALYDKIVGHLKAQGCTSEAIEKFCKPNEYKGEISYCFGFNASNFTFERVEKFGVMDANFVFSQNDKGFVNAKIQIVDKKEQINGYEAPEEREDECDGWSTTAPEIKQQPIGDGSHAEPNPIETFGVPAYDPNSLNPQPSDLPF